MGREELGGEDKAVAGAVGHEQVGPARSGAGDELQHCLLADLDDENIL